MRRTLLTLVTLIAALTAAAPAHAGFLIPIVLGAAFAATAAGAILTFALNIAAGFALSYIAKSFLKKDAPEQQAYVGGLQLDIRVDPKVPETLLVGRAVTAGSLIYAATYGKRGEVDNSDLIEVISIADHPCASLVSVFLEGEVATLQASVGDRGQPIADYSDKLAIKFFDGSQTTADAFAISKLGTATNPWTAEHIGRGRTYARVHSIYDQDKVPGRLRWRFVVDGIRLYDPRLDSSVGGAGTHRFDDTTTHAWTDNPVVIAYNIIRGIYVVAESGREIFYGIEGTAADQLPFDNWVAAMNECDVLVALDAGGTEKQYRCGGEISIETEALATVKELLRTCNGRLVEIGGTYKIYLGAPGVPIMSIVDGDLLASRDDMFMPVLPLESRVNYITGSYTEPADGWISAEATPRENATWRVLDGRRLPADLTVPMVQSGTQLQRLMQQGLNRSRRERRHHVPLPPSAFALEPGDIIEWASDRNGYDAKLFEVDGVDYDANLLMKIAITEVDPTDYDWVPADEQPKIDGRIITARPSPKAIDGFDAAPYVDTGTETARPAILLTWVDPEDGDVSAVRWQLRTAEDPSNETSGVIDDATVEAAVIRGGMQPDTDYEIRARFESFNGYAAAWSLWIPVTTPDVRFGTHDFAAALRARVTQEFDDANARIEEIANVVARKLMDLSSRHWLDKQETRRLLSVREGVLSASIEEVMTVAVDTQTAFASYQTTVNATLGSHSASISTNATAIADLEDGVAAIYQLTVDVDGKISGFKLGSNGTTSYFDINTDIFRVGSTGVAGGTFIPVFQVGVVSGSAAIALRGNLLADGAIIARTIAADAITAGKIAAGAIDAGDIIVDNIIITGHIQSEQITVVRSGVQSSAVTITAGFPGNISDPTPVFQSTTVTTATVNGLTGTVVVWAYLQPVCDAGGGTFEIPGDAYAEIVDDTGATVISALIDEIQTITTFDAGIASVPRGNVHTKNALYVPLIAVATPTDGNRTFTLRIRRSSDLSMTATGGIAVMESKR